MSVASRTFRSSPHRDATATWAAIVDLLTRGTNDSARQELSRVAGLAASTIADRATLETPIWVTCDGPRTRVYCVYDDDALDESNGNETSLGFDPLNGDWHVSLPCFPDDLDWVQRGLAAHSQRITARGPDTALQKSAAALDGRDLGTLVLDRKGFLGS